MNTGIQTRLSRRQLLQGLGAAALVAGASGVRGAARHPVAIAAAGGETSPQWDAVFDAALGAGAMGYTYAVAQNGEPVSGAGVNLARSGAESVNPNQRWTRDTLFNLASVSKTIAAVAMMTVVQRQGAQILDTPFWPLFVQSGRFSGTPGAGVDTVTVRQLLTMRSGLVEDGTLYLKSQSVDEFLAGYLQTGITGTPGTTNVYSNTNFTILQVLYEVLSSAAPGSYVDLVKERVLVPLGIDTSREITDLPAAQTEALSYSGPIDPRAGRAWARMQCMGPGGWLGTANGVLKFLVGLRGSAVLEPRTVEMMFTQQLGWYRAQSPYGPYYQHNGGLFSGEDPAQEVHTGAIHFPSGYDAVLFINSPGRPIGLMAKAFTSQAAD